MDYRLLVKRCDNGDVGRGNGPGRGWLGTLKSIEGDESSSAEVPKTGHPGRSLSVGINMELLVRNCLIGLPA